MRFTVLIGAMLILAINHSLSTLPNSFGQNDNSASDRSDTTVGQKDLDETLGQIDAGHSSHGDAFNEGPRQAAYLMEGTGCINFPVTTRSALAQKFINQGMGQLHGFWYLEAERSFRQAIDLDDTCAMAYWGAAWATSENKERARGFVGEAVQRKHGVCLHDQMYIDALEKYLDNQSDDKTELASQLLKDLESISLKFPDDLEIKALIAHRVWQNGRAGIPISSYLAVDALLDQVFAVQPNHPAHHYAIHLWDDRSPEKALRSAAACGPAAPGIAHMWHMPGHIYSRLHRYEDAIYQQEASARVDHAHMIRDQLVPDQIHNFAHNNEWLIRNLAFVGRVHDAIQLATNMIQLPQHPKYNTLEKDNGSASYGRKRLLQVLREYELYDQAIKFCQTPGSLLISKHTSNNSSFEEPIEAKISRLRLLGCASGIRRLETQSNASVEELNLIRDQQSDQKKMIDLVDKAKLAIEGYQLAGEGNYLDASIKLESATGEDASWLAELKFLGGAQEEGLAEIEKQVQDRPQQVIPLARLAYLQYQHGNVADSQKTLTELRNVSHFMDLDNPLLDRLKPIVNSLNLPPDWRLPYHPKDDIGARPTLDSLGPFCWSPPKSPAWSLRDANEKTVGLSELRGQPHVLIFYLGHGCLHCAEQLNAFAPRVLDFENAGLKMLAISSDDQVGLQNSIDSFSGQMPIRLASDESLTTFKQFRAFDDFENQPLHGTFLIDGSGNIVWHDIGYEPFMDHEFLLNEAKRLIQ